MPPLTELRPPWIEFPDIPWGSVGWRMGHGEAYWLEWENWWKSEVPPEQKSAYRSRWLEPSGWEGFYAFMAVGQIPPRVDEEGRKTQAAAEPPRAGEDSITERYRVKWLATVYFRKPKTFVRDPYERECHQFMVDPDGWLWKLHFPISTDPDCKTPYFTRQLNEVVGNDNLPVRQPVA